MEELINKFEEFFSAKLQKDIQKLASNYPQERSLSIDYNLLSEFDPALADELIKKPDKIIDAAEQAIIKMDVPVAVGTQFEPHVRFYNLPEEYDVMVQYLGADQINKLIRVEGVVSLITDIQPRIKVATWECIHCKTKVQTVSEKTKLVTPVRCPNEGCGRKDFKLLEEESTFVSMQRAQIQDLVERLKGNSPASHIELWLEDDLTNKIAPGEHLVVTGVLRLRKQVKRGNVHSSIYHKFLDVIHVQKVEREFEELEITKEEEKKLVELSKRKDLYDIIKKSIAPSIYGYDEMKEAIALQLFGGTPGKVMPDGERVRSDIHILLIGDPGTGKSTLLEYVSHLAPKCIYVSGKGSSSAGLTATAEKDELSGGWTLKAGAVVLASGGMVAIDEFDKMDPSDRGSIHEAMEQQKVSVAKAGIVTQFPARTSILAAANPKLGRFDPNIPPVQQFDIPPTLLSRFDLIFSVRDVLDETKDKEMAEHILKGHKFSGEPKESDEYISITPPIDVDLLRKYIAFARKNIRPILTDQAMDKIKDFYLDLRRLGTKENTFPITAREIEGLIRLAEASAKSRLAPKVEIQDAERAIRLANFVLQDVFVDRETGKLDSDIINIGVSKSKIDRVRTIMRIISELEQEYDLVSYEDVIKNAEKENIDPVYTRKLIAELKRQGELYEPKSGFIKTSNPKGW